MASSEEKQHLETLLADTFGSALDSVRRSLAGEIQRHADARARSARAETRRDLRDAAARLDACRRQSDLLSALLEEAGRFASRTALWITTADGARGWAGYGFDGGPAIDSLRADYDDAPWNEVARGTGCVEIEGEAAAAVASTMGPGRPERAVLVPLVLRDRVAAVLYADELGDDESLSLEAIQLLTTLSALLLEIQGLRERDRTPTLHPATDAVATLPLWEAGGGTVGRPAPTPTAPPPRVEAPPEPEPAEEPPPQAPEEESLWEEAEDLPETEVEEIEEVQEIEAPDLDEFEVEDLPEAEVMEEARPADETTAAIPSQVGAEPTVRISQEMIDEAQGATPPAAAPEVEEVAEVEAVAEIEEVEDLEEIEEVEAEPVEEDEEDASEDNTVLLDRSKLPDADAAPPPPAAPKPTAPVGSSEVAPPPDLEGPGLAFRHAEETPPADEGDEETAAAHEEARRLARLLVSEIKLYNEEEVEAGRRSNDIYQRLQEDIDRSRQMYRDRVDPRVRDDVDYFQQELVNILGGGDPDALGL